VGGLKPGDVRAPGGTGAGGGTPSIVLLKEAGPGWGRPDGVETKPQFGQAPVLSGAGDPHWGQGRISDRTIALVLARLRQIADGADLQPVFAGTVRFADG
jgi:hypothetical protein